ncbi:GNAT family N-acetyltransferase [Saccharopolyspora sp. NPDC000359]|uniref:GNAT family N-acetyltransferase n=1 Tax=Saccharopolyspora sp. NPDC000359 TaxID=3154251 RepID=UPI00331C4482
MTITIRQARDERDADVVATMWTEVSEWLAKQGTDQWQYPVRIDALKSNVAAGSVWLAEDDGEPVGTITIDLNSDPGLWSSADLADAVVIHRLVVKRSHAGRGIAAKLLQHAEQVGRRLGRHWIRLDAWTNNTALHDYYRRIGFRFVRKANTEQLPYPARESAVLFERPIPHTC